MQGSCEHGNKLSVCVKQETFLNCLRKPNSQVTQLRRFDADDGSVESVTSNWRALWTRRAPSRHDVISLSRCNNLHVHKLGTN
jgi:hypothetical protein